MSTLVPGSRPSASRMNLGSTIRPAWSTIASMGKPYHSNPTGPLPDPGLLKLGAVPVAPLSRRPGERPSDSFPCLAGSSLVKTVTEERTRCDERDGSGQGAAQHPGYPGRGEPRPA